MNERTGEWEQGIAHRPGFGCEAIAHVCTSQRAAAAASATAPTAVR